MQLEPRGDRAIPKGQVSSKSCAPGNDVAAFTKWESPGQPETQGCEVSNVFERKRHCTEGGNVETVDSGDPRRAERGPHGLRNSIRLNNT